MQRLKETEFGVSLLPTACCHVSGLRKIIIIEIIKIIENNKNNKWIKIIHMIKAIHITKIIHITNIKHINMIKL